MTEDEEYRRVNSPTVIPLDKGIAGPSQTWNSNRAEQIATQWQRILDNVAQLTSDAKRPIDSVEVLPTTKNQPDEAVTLLHSLGQRRFAENRPQELVRKFHLFNSLEDIEWVMIGHLQRNKARDIAQFATSFEALDSLRIATTLNDRIEQLDKSGQYPRSPLPVLIQVNASGEPQKHGFCPAEVPDVLEELAKLPHLNVTGFMTMAPHVTDEIIIRTTFSKVRELRDSLAPKWSGKFDLKELSMGMSHDYPIAIEEGSTQLRLGTIIFGQRDYSA